MSSNCSFAPNEPGTQATQVVAGSGNTTITGGLGIDKIVGGSGTNVLYSGDGGNTFIATSVTGGSGTTTMTGGAGVYQLTAGSGKDTLIAGSGTGTFYDGIGTATYQINSNSGNVTIYGSGSSDTLQLGAGIPDITASTNGNSVTLTLGEGGSVTIDAGALSQATFADGSVATFAQLLSPEFTVGNTTYASVDGVLSPVPNSTTNSSQNTNIGATTTYELRSSGTGAMIRDGAQIRTKGAAPVVQNLTLIGTLRILYRRQSANNEMWKAAV